MSSMSDFRKQMEQVNEPGLMKESKERPEGKTFKVDNSNSVSNHMMAYRQMLGLENPTTINEGVEVKKAKATGAIQVIQEILSKSNNADPVKVMEQIKMITKDI
jgi:hypothetical protein